MGNELVTVVIAIGVPAVIGFLASAWMVWKRPLTVHAWLSRRALGKAGLAKRWIVTPAGRMAVWEGGSGPCMVLLHGAGDQAGAWARVVRPLVESHRVMVPDLPGHWKSDPRSGPLSVEDVLRGVAVLMQARCPDRAAILVGNSLGAWVALLYAHEHPGRVDRLIAINGGALRLENPGVNLLPADRAQAAATMKGLMGPATPATPGFVLDDIVRQAAHGPAARLAATAGDMDRFLLDGRLGEVVVPVDLVWGDADGLFTMDYARRLLDGLPRARLHVVHGCGHVPHRECPVKVLAALEEALAAPPPKAKEALEK